jgi:two-component system sensor histidine kinase UhpB
MKSEARAMAARLVPHSRVLRSTQSEPPSERPGWARIALRAPLFWKLLLPQLLLVAVLLAVAITAVGVGTEKTLIAVLVAGPIVTALLSAWALRLALRPIRTLTETAQRVKRGDWSARATPSPLADRQVEHLGLVLNEMLDAMVQARQTQRQVSRLVLDAEEREREQIAHEIYAGTAQTLAGVLIRLRVLDRALATGDPGPVLDEVTSEVRTALEEVRAVARRLRPPELDELGIRAALEAHGRRLTEHAGPAITFEGDIPEEDLEPGARLALFRIVQEGVTNAVLHARASRVRVEFTTLPAVFRADVVDDGVGFDPVSATPTTDSHLGLVGMRERADYVGGDVSVRSASGSGTSVRLDLPWGLREPPADSTISSRAHAATTGP